MAWITTADWILLDHVVDVQSEMRLFVESNGSALVTYKGRWRNVTTDVSEARGLTQSSAETIADNENSQSSDTKFVSACASRANDAGAYTVRKVEVTYGNWHNIPVTQQGS